ncbi:MAG TPA: peptidylprolyl isomerase [Acidimicrobiales bacterium]|nr:peptidylprolyl isomerase [Acidimicrobiales bacterium]
MRRLPTLLTALAVGLAVLATGCGSVSPYAAKVDDRSISEDELEKELRSIAANGPYLKLVESRQQVKGAGANTFDASFTALALTRQIYYELIGAELARRKLSVGPPDLAAARETVIEQIQGEDVFKDFPEEYQEELIRRQAQLDLLTLSLNGHEGSAEEAARAYYDSHRNDFATACVSHILVPDQAKADDVRARIAGGQDFAAVARTESQDTQSAQKGGELGCGIDSETGFVPEFMLAVFNQQVGEVGPPVKSQFGYHVIKVTSRNVPPFEEVKGQARQKLATTGQEKLLTWLQETVGKAKIEVNPKYGTFNKEGASPGVVPPARPADATPTSVGISPAPAAPGGQTRP